MAGGRAALASTGKYTRTSKEELLRFMWNGAERHQLPMNYTHALLIRRHTIAILQRAFKDLAYSPSNKD
jgi:hypothetical protein